MNNEPKARKGNIILQNLLIANSKKIKEFALYLHLYDMKTTTMKRP